MTGWDIDVAGVRGVLRKTGTAAKNLSDTGTAMQGNLEEAASAAGTLTSQYGPYTSTAGVVGSALGEFLQHWSRDLVYIAKRASRSLNGAAEATGHYVQGDLELAANAQHQAAKEPKVDLPGVSGNGGRTGGRG
ncbi:DUF6507 family protein [Streptomyces echinoruber]|uniref:Uncharacterized protein n=1 Tax=Streptomyces echinoruber TaxID=68898 RepID=A0A918VS03_9ACTN|nr:DUF6507 family protein [Streptomyces echinoruber]GHA19360.1 hypothetical protein GCM10010389_66300 [Streptomyces echinoruber]